MVKVLVGSENPAKVAAVERAFTSFFPEVSVEGRAVPSRVADQPFGEETFAGAENRVAALEGEKADFYCAIEGGIADWYGRRFCFAVACVSDGKVRHFGVSPAFELPLALSRGAEKQELGLVAERLTGMEGMKKGQGVVGFLTGGRMSRAEMCAYAVLLALAPFGERFRWLDAYRYQR